MTRDEVLRAMEEAAFLPVDSLQGTEPLSSLSKWDSLTGAEFRLIVQDRWQVSLSGPAVLRCETVADILELLGSHLED